jgi:hypothetical protein
MINLPDCAFCSNEIKPNSGAAVCCGIFCGIEVVSSPKSIVVCCLDIVVENVVDVLSKNLDLNRSL